jgi:hypothetical protein
MRRLISAATAVGLGLASWCWSTGHADAEIVISINKAKQRMAVLVDGTEQHRWTVSTGTGGGPPSGSYRPARLERKWFSRKYGMSPMPYSIFFHEGYAIHGTVYLSRLGQRASHGCVRLHPNNAATLFALVQARGMAATTIMISNTEFARPINLRPTLSTASEASETTASVPASPPPPPAFVPDTDIPPEYAGAIPSPPAAPAGVEE